MKKNFKLFSTADGNQILFERRNDDEDGEQVTVVVHLEGVRLKITHGYKDNEQAADEAFESFTPEKAEEHYVKIKAITA